MASGLLFAQPMPGRLSFLAFVMYLSLDLSNPFIAGAFNFNPDECVEAAHREHRPEPAAHRSIGTAQRVLDVRAERQRVVTRAAAPEPRTAWRQPAPLAHAAPAPPAPTEDH